MAFRAFIGFVFALNLVLGNVCLVGTVYAALPPESASRELLSREVPMSFEVVVCAWVKTEDGWQPTADSPCASGHCLKKNAPEPPCTFAGAGASEPAALPVSPNDEFSASVKDIPLPEPIESPPDREALTSVVLRE